MEQLIETALSLIKKGSSQRTSIEELENIRIGLAAIRFELSEKYLKEFSNKKSLNELRVDHVESDSFGKLYNAYIDKYLNTTEGKKKYTKSICESLARKTYKLEGSSYYKAKEEYLFAKDEVDRLYQVLKSIDNFSHAISSRIKG